MHKHTSRRYRQRTIEEKEKILREVDQAKKEGVPVKKIFSRYKVTSSQVNDWAKQAVQGTLRSRVEKKGSAVDLVKSVETALMQRDAYRAALVDIKNELEKARAA
jgi:transposase-like protein